MEPAAWSHDTEYIAFGVTWRSGDACLDLVDTVTGQKLEVPIVQRHIAFRTSGPEKYCTGRYTIVDGTETAQLPCPHNRPVNTGTQCDECADADEFRLIHHVHTGGYAPEPLIRYLAQPHWVYIASFADGTSKVGTAARSRKRSRLDEQGPYQATYVADAADGKTARYVEDAVSENLAVSQFKRRASKAAAWAKPLAMGEIAVAHQNVLDRAVRMVKEFTVRVPSLTALQEPWPVPAAMRDFRDAPSMGWTPYANDLRSGEHGLYISACAGQVALGVTSLTADEPVVQVIDLGLLKGRKICPGDFSSAEAAFQGGLF